MNTLFVQAKHHQQSPTTANLPAMSECHRQVSRQLPCGLGKYLSNTVVNLSNNKNNASFWTEIPHSNLSEFREGHTCRPLSAAVTFSCDPLYVQYSAHHRNYEALLSAATQQHIFLNKFLVREQVLPIQSSHFVNLKTRHPIPHSLRAPSDP